MRRAARIIAAIVLVARLAAFHPQPASAEASLETSLEETKQLLQKGLTVHEIDSEVARLSQQEAGINRDMDANQRAIADYEQKTAESRKRAGLVLRAYYEGERGSLWLLLFHAKGLQSALTVYDYLSMIFQNDKNALQSYRSSMDRLTAMNGRLDQTRRQLEQVKTAFLQQKQHLQDLQQQLDSELARQSDGDAIRKQIDDLNASWEQKGAPLFKSYLEAMAAAMKQLPDYITRHQDSLEMDGFNYTLTLTDSGLNEFLQGQNPIFKNVKYAFSKNKITISGAQDGTELQMDGHYVLEQKPRNLLRFTIDRLTYNGFLLPDTTVQALQKQTDLSIAPQDMAPFLIATGVSVDDGVMQVRLSLSLSL